MISVSSEFTTAIQSNNRQWKIVVQIQRDESGSPWIDISDRILSSDITHDYQQRNATVNLTIDNYDYSLSPLNRNSTTNQNGGVYDPLLDSRHNIQIQEGILTSNGYEYITKFTGVLGDEIDADSIPGQIQISARDKSKLLMDCFIYQSKTYYGWDLENVIQDMINQFLPNSNITVQVQQPTLWMIGRPDRPYTASNTTLWDACQLLADSGSQELRFTEDGTLVLRKVIRDFSTQTAAVTFDQGSLTSDKSSTSDADVRNHVVLKVTGLNPIEMKDQNSINIYGDRYYEVQQSLANIVATQEQGIKLVQEILKDLSYVRPVDNFELALYPQLQVADFIAIDNDMTGVNSTYDIFQVVQTVDSYSPTRKRTQVSVQGKNEYTPSNAIAPNSPTGLTSSFLTRTIQNYTNSGWSGNSKTISIPEIKWTPPTTDVSGNSLSASFGGYSIYRNVNGSTGNAIPIGSVKSYLDSLGITVNYFYDYTASGGTTYNYQIVAISQMGGVSASSNALSVSVPAITYQ